MSKIITLDLPVTVRALGSCPDYNSGIGEASALAEAVGALRN